MDPHLLIKAVNGVEVAKTSESETVKTAEKQKETGKVHSKSILHRFRIVKFSGYEGSYTEDDVSQRGDYDEDVEVDRKKKSKSCGCFSWLKRR